jgi:phosphatidylserine/phosphatidylglycerophosphate/cardiolipin synthase-like enzyme
MFRTHVGKNAGVVIERHIKHADKSIKICSPFISPEYAKILTQLAKKGISVKLITSEARGSNFKNNNNNGFWNNEPSLHILSTAKSLADFFNADIRYLKNPPLEYRIMKYNFVHAKLYVIDGKYAVVGSANLTEYGMTKNVEHLIVTDNREEVRQLEKDFEELWT